MNLLGHHNILQKFIPGQGELISPMRRKVTAFKAPEQCKFLIQWLTEEPEREAQPRPGEEDSFLLEIGSTYTIQARMDENLTIRSDFVLRLICSEPGVSIEPSEHVIPQAAARDSFYNFEISTASPWAADTARLELLCQTTEGTETKSAASMTVRLVDALSSASPELRDLCHIDTKQRLSKGVVVVLVEESDDKLRLNGWGLPRKLFLDPFPRPDISLAAFVEGETPPETVLNAIRHFSRKAPPQWVGWLTRLIRRYGDQLTLVIVDCSGSDFPWEMMQLTTDLGEELPLGAMAVVSRWIPVQFYSDWHDLEVKEETCSGDVIAFLDHKELGCTELEKVALSEFSADFVADLSTLRDRLHHPLHSTGLVYVGCHGTFVDVAHHKQFEDDITALRLIDPHNRLLMLDFETIQRHSDDRPIVFINACHSARLIRNSLWQLVGLPEVILARVARGYIGTIGPVGDAYAASVVIRLAQEIGLSPSGTNIGQVLRRLRADAVANLRVSQSEDERRRSQERYLYSFMYVYYGNPFARLRLASAPQGDPVVENHR